MPVVLVSDGQLRGKCFPSATVWYNWWLCTENQVTSLNLFHCHNGCKNQLGHHSLTATSTKTHCHCSLHRVTLTRSVKKRYLYLPFGTIKSDDIWGADKKKKTCLCTYICKTICLRTDVDWWSLAVKRVKQHMHDKETRAEIHTEETRAGTHTEAKTYLPFLSSSSAQRPPLD